MFKLLKESDSGNGKKSRSETEQWPNALQIALQDQEGVEPNREASVYDHLDKFVRNLSDKTAASGSEPKLPLVRVKADYSGFSTIIPQRFGQKYIGKVANPNDILVFSRSTQKHQK